MYNDIFDKVIKDDTTIEIEVSSEFPKNMTFESSDSSELVYDSQERYYDLKAILDNKEFSETQKITFLNSALNDINDNNRNQLRKIRTTQSDFWQKSESSREIAKKYFEGIGCFENPVPFKMNDFLIFKLLNNYPESIDIIDKYVESIDNGYERNQGWSWIVHYLAKFGKVEKGVNLLEKCVEEFDGKIKNRISVEIFGNYLFNEDKNISKKAADIYFNYLHKEKYDQYDNLVLSVFIDKKRHFELLDYWFDYYSSLNFEEIDTKNFNMVEVKKVQPEFDAYFSFMKSQYLGLQNGRKVWYEFFKKILYWEKYKLNNFQSNQLYILSNVFQDNSISLSDKQKILLESKKNERLLKNDIYTQIKYKKLVKIAYPNNDISKEDFENLCLKEIGTEIPENLKDLIKEPISLTEIEDIIKKINKFANQYNFKNINPSFKDKIAYISHIQPLQEVQNTLIFEFLRQNKMLVDLYSEYEDEPPDYNMFFEKKFKHILIENEETDIKMLHLVDTDGYDLFYNRIYVVHKSNVYITDFVEYRTRRFRPKYLVKLINQCLIDKKIKKRLVGIDLMDSIEFYAFIEPNLIKELLNEFNIENFALNWGYNDEFSNS